MKKNHVITLSAVLLAASVLGIMGTQVFSGRNPGDLIMFVLLMIAGGSVQTIVFLVFKPKGLKIAPVILAIAVAAWGTFLYLTAASWANAAVTDLICDYCAPAVGAIASLVLLGGFPDK